MQTNPDLIFEYAQLLDIRSLKRLFMVNKSFNELGKTRRFVSLFKDKYIKLFPLIKFKSHIYQYEYKRKIYINNDENYETRILVICIDHENWKPYTDANVILENIGKINNNIIEIDDRWTFINFEINLEWYDLGIQYIRFEDSGDDSGYSSVCFRRTRYMEHYQPDLYKQLIHHKNEIKKLKKQAENDVPYIPGIFYISDNDDELE